MKAAWYEKQGPANQVLTVGEMPDRMLGPEKSGFGSPLPASIPGTSRSDKIRSALAWRIHVSFRIVMARGMWMRWAAVSLPSGSDERSGVLDSIVPAIWNRSRIHRGAGGSIAPLPDGVSMEQAACLGIPGITPHRAVHVAGDVNGKTVLIQGAAGSVGTVPFSWRTVPALE